MSGPSSAGSSVTSVIVRTPLAATRPFTPESTFPVPSAPLFEPPPTVSSPTQVGKSGYGRLIVVDHLNGLNTYYAHLSRIDVIPGQEVRLGQIVGGCGASGRVTSPHLHYEVRRGGSPVNPYPYLAKSTLAVASAKKDAVFGF